MIRNWKMGDSVGRQIGKFIDIDIDKNEIARGEYIRVRVCIDISKPLLRGKRICVGAYKPFWVRFAYERLPNFCYLCGTIGHSQKECSHWKSSMESYTVSNFSYGSWLCDGNFGDYGGPIRDRQLNSQAANHPMSYAAPNSGENNYGNHAVRKESNCNTAGNQEQAGN